MPNLDTPGAGGRPGGSGENAEKAELRVVLSTEGGIKLEDARKEIRLVVTASDEAAKALQKSSDALSKAADQMVRVAQTLSRTGKEATKSAQETAKAFDTVATGAVFKGNLLASAVTGLVKGAGGLVVGFLRTQAEFARGVADAFSEQTAQIVRQTEAYDRYSISLAAVLRDEDRVRQVQRSAFKAGAESPFSIREFEDASQRLVRTPGTRELFFGAEKDVEANSERLFRLVSRLASTDPRLGVAGAVQAVRVGLQGQFRLLTRQYGISIGELVEVSGKSIKQLRGNSDELLKALETISARNFPDEYVRQLTQLPSNLASNIRELATVVVPREIGKAGFQDNVAALLDEFYKSLFEFAKPDGALAKKYAPRISDALSRTVASLVRGAANIVGASIGEGANPFEALFDGIAKVADKLADYVEKIANLTESPEAREFFRTFFERGTEVFGKFVDSVFGFAQFIPQLSAYVLRFATTVVEASAWMVRQLSSGVSYIDQLLSGLPGSVGDEASKRVQRDRASVAFDKAFDGLRGLSTAPSPETESEIAKRLNRRLGYAASSPGNFESERENFAVTATDIAGEIRREAVSRSNGDRAAARRIVNDLIGQIESRFKKQATAILGENFLGFTSFDPASSFSFDALGSVPTYAPLRRDAPVAVPGSVGAIGSGFQDRFRLRRPPRSNVGTIGGDFANALTNRGGDFVNQGALSEEEAYRGLLTTFERAALQFDETRARADVLRTAGKGIFDEAVGKAIGGDFLDVGELPGILDTYGRFTKSVASAESAQSVKILNEAFKALSELDPTDVGSVNRALGEVGIRFKSLSAIFGENGQRQFGIGGATGLAAGAFNRFGTTLADRSVRDLTLFGSTPQLQLRAAEQRLDFLRREGGLYGTLLAKYRETFKVTEEREAFETEITRQIAKQAEEYERLAAKLAFDVAKEKNPLVKGFSRLDLIKLDDETGRPRLKTAKEQFEEVGVELGASFVTGFSSATGDTLFNVVTGRFDDIRQVWQNLIESMLKIFTDFLGKLITSQLFDQVFDVSGTLAGVGGGGGSLGSFASAGDFVNPGAIGGVYAIGGVATRPQFARVGEGGSSELVAPLTRRGRLPLSMTTRGPAAVLPGGRLIPTEFMSQPTPNFAAAQRPVVNVAVLVDPREITARGLVANGATVASVAAANVRNGGALAGAFRRG